MPPRPVKPAGAGQVCVAAGNLPAAAAAGQTAGPFAGFEPLTAIPVLSAALVVACVLVLLLRRRGGERQRALGQLLDAADGLEARLREARAEIEAVAGSDENPVREAMQEMLRQRLWLQQHGEDASLDQLRSVRDSIEDARRRIDQQLAQVERARAAMP